MNIFEYLIAVNDFPTDEYITMLAIHKGEAYILLIKSEVDTECLEK